MTTRSGRKTPLSHHPLWEEAQLIRDLLREDARLARSGSGVVLIAGSPDEYIPRLREEAQRLEHLATIDYDYPQEEV